MFQCLVCGHDELEELQQQVRDSKEHRIVKCCKCTHIQLFPLPLVEHDESFYHENRQTRNLIGDSALDLIRLKGKYSLDIERRRKIVEQYMGKESKILEIGAGYGFFIEEMLKAGHDIEGIEISGFRRKLIKDRLNTNIYDINLLKQEPSQNLVEKYDVAVLFQVLEHISKPLLFINRATKVLKSGGILIIEVPNVRDHALEVSEAYNDFFWQRAHLSYFAPDMLVELIRSSNLKIIDMIGIQRYGLDNLFHWLAFGERPKKQTQLELASSLEWLNEAYKNKICGDLRSDTFMIICGKK